MITTFSTDGIFRDLDDIVPEACMTLPRLGESDREFLLRQMANAYGIFLAEMAQGEDPTARSALLGATDEDSLARAGETLYDTLQRASAEAPERIESALAVTRRQIGASLPDDFRKYREAQASLN